MPLDPAGLELRKSQVVQHKPECWVWTILANPVHGTRVLAESSRLCQITEISYMPSSESEHRNMDLPCLGCSGGDRKWRKGDQLED